MLGKHKLSNIKNNYFNVKERISMKKIRIAICGYGNLGKGVEKEIQKNPDMELVGIFSRRPAEELNTKSRLLSIIT